MKFLFVHQNFPGQYVHAARHLAQAGHEVSFITQPRTAEIEGVRKIEYRPAQSVSGSHAYLHELESSVENGLAVARVCRWLDRDGSLRARAQICRRYPSTVVLRPGHRAADRVPRTDLSRLEHYPSGLNRKALYFLGSGRIFLRKAGGHFEDARKRAPGPIAASRFLT